MTTLATFFGDGDKRCATTAKATTEAIVVDGGNDSVNGTSDVG